MAEEVSPVTLQVTKGNMETWSQCVDVRLEEVEDCLVYDRHGVSAPFKKLYQDRRAVIIFLRDLYRKTIHRRASIFKVTIVAGQMPPTTTANARMDLEEWRDRVYSCKEYVDDLSKIPREALEDADIRLIVIGQSSHHHIEPFCSLTGYPYEIYVDPHRCIYQKLGMRREEKFTNSATPSPHVKSGVFLGQMKSIWRAMTSPVFDFQGDLHQQGGAIIAGPDNFVGSCLFERRQTGREPGGRRGMTCSKGSQVHFSHFDMNHLDHMPITWLLQLAGVQQTLDFSDKPKIIHV